MADIVMPQLGETVTEGTITKWFKKVGDTIAQDEVLFEVSTDKVDSEVPSTASGVLTEIRVPEGETVDVGTVLAVIGDGTAPGAAASGPASASAPASAAAGPAPADAAAAGGAPPPPPAPGAEAAEPAGAPGGQEEPAAAPATAGAGQAPPGPSTEAAPGPSPGASPPEAPAPSGGDGDGRLLSPIVRRLVTEHNLDTGRIEGTGPGGRITRSDVERAIEAGTATRAATGRTAPAAGAPAAAAGAAPPGLGAPPAPSLPAPSGPAGPAPAAASRVAREAGAVPPRIAVAREGTRVPLNRIRRITGEHMVMSKATSPHVLTAMEVDFEGVEQVRRAVRERWKAEEGSSLTYLPFIARAVCDTIRDFPYLNASVDGGELVLHGEVNLGIAVDLNFEGLVAPVVRRADDKRLRAIAREIVDLAERARSKRLNPDELAGGTFTLTNPGQYGTLMQFPIINQPQVAILSTDGVKRRPVVVADRFGSESIAIHSVGVLALAWDHRAFDGAYAAAFLARLRDTIEGRDWAAEVS